MVRSSGDPRTRSLGNLRVRDPVARADGERGPRGGRGGRTPGAVGTPIILAVPAVRSRNNGGDGLVAARHLQSAGLEVTVGFTARIHELKGDTRINAEIVTAMAVRFVFLDPEDPLRELRAVVAARGSSWTRYSGPGWIGRSVRRSCA